MMIRRSTAKKRLIQQLLTAMDHPTANDIYEKAKQIHPQISLGTVYRNLGQMVSDNDVTRVALPGAPDRFDWNTSDHYHVTCSQCGRIHDVGEFTTQLLEPLDHSIKSATGVVVTERSMRFTGICAQCRQAGE